MVEWLAGNRIRGTSTERTTTAGIGNEVGGWKEIGRKTVGTAGKTIDVSGLDNKRYYMILTDAQVTGGTMQMNHRIGTGSYANSGYSHRRSDNGGTDATVNTANEMAMENLTSAYPRFTVSYLSNTAGKEKLNIGTLVADDSGAPERSQCVNKWTGTTDVNQIQAVTEATGNFAVGAEIVILGWDEDDTHTENFWEELTSADVTSSNIDVSFTAKKYLMVQYQCELAVYNNNSFGIRFNGGTSGYSRRFSQKGVAISPENSQNKISFIYSGNKKIFGTAFIINNASKNKLLMCEQVGEENTAGGAYAPFRWEFAGKSTLQDQITSIQLLDTVLPFISGHIKVWGHD